jgi:alginate O-acetyltransferase complex protein AlgJ
VAGTDLAWRTGPAQRTWRGNTLLIGDSFTYQGLSVLMPLFRHGRLMWSGADNSPIVQAVPKADTVVIEIVQRYVGASAITQTAFRKAVKHALRAHDRRR